MTTSTEKTVVVRYVDDVNKLDAFFNIWAKEEKQTRNNNLFKCHLCIMVEGITEDDRPAIKERCALHTRHWAKMEVLPIHRESSDRLIRLQVVDLIDVLLRFVGKGASEMFQCQFHHTALWWSPKYPVWTAAGSALWAAVDNVRWLSIPESPWTQVAREAFEARRIKPNFNLDQLPKTLVGESRSVQDTLELIKIFAPYDLPVLVLGETGTGKEVVARLIHEMSKRKGKFVEFNAALCSPERAVSELFGHVKGSFTGAYAARPGAIHGAEGGTFFLDELNSLELGAQAKLLRALANVNEGRIEVRAFGADTSSTVNVRLISAAQSLDVLKEDIVQRVAGVVIELSPLRERKEDIRPLVDFILKQMRENMQKDGPRKIEPAAVERLKEYDWPGNVRELQRVLRQAWILAHDKGSTRISHHHLPRLGAGVSSLHSSHPAKTSSRTISTAHPTPDWSGRLRGEVAALIEARWREASAAHPSGSAAARSLGFETGQQVEKYLHGAIKLAQKHESNTP